MVQMSGSRMKVAGRFKPCLHMGCFDLDVFVELNQRSRKASFYTLCKIGFFLHFIDSICLSMLWFVIAVAMSNLSKELCAGECYY